MKFVATEDIAAPVEAAWARIADFDRFEDRIGRRVEGLTRSPPGPVEIGTTWRARADVNGKVRAVEVALVRLDAPHAMVLEGGTEGLRVRIEAVLEPLGERRSRLTVATEARARTLSARLLLQSAKLARATMAKRYKARIAALASELETAARRA